MSTSEPSRLEDRARRIRLLLTDVDGVLTDGRLYYGPSGEELKVFHVHDGLAVKLARQAGLEVGLLTARSGPALDRRAADLGISELMSGVRDKLAALDDLLTRRGLEAAEVAFIGDDLPDLGVLRRVGLAVAPCNAVPEVLQAAHLVVDRRGGDGVLRQVVERLLRWRGEWERVVGTFATTSPS